jgi:hypothetical protein
MVQLDESTPRSVLLRISIGETLGEIVNKWLQGNPSIQVGEH